MRVISHRREAGATASAHRATWPWAVGSVLVVAIVLITTLVARQVIAGTRHAAQTVPALALPPAAVASATPADVYIQLAALDASAGHLVALTSATRPQCPPVGNCPAAPTVTAFAMFDAATGQPVATTALTGPAAASSDSVLLLADAGRHVAYAVSPHAVTLFSTMTGAVVGSYALPPAAWQRESGGVLDTQRGILVLAGGSHLLALNAATGSLRASRDLGTGATISALTLDPATGIVYALLHPAGAAQPVLAAYDGVTLAPVMRLPLPTGARLGPFDAASGTLYLPGASDGTCAYSPRDSRRVAEPVGVCNALALGWNAATNHFYTADADGLTVRESAAGRALAALPIRAAWSGDQPLLVDSARGLLYVPDESGTVLIVRDGAQSTALAPGSALLLARAALAKLLPNTNQDPPFVAPEMFPATSGTRPESYWIHFSDLGWQGPYPGSAASAVAPLAGSAGGYTVTFTITWNQLFLRTHSWTCTVSLDGTVRLAAETGDAVP